jgi:hypothetical protein
MKKSFFIAAVALCLGLLVCAPAFAQKNTQKNSEKDKAHRLNVATASEGEKVRGPRTIKPVFVNRIRYRVSVKTKTAFTAGPSLALPFIPQIPGGGGTGGGQNATNLAERAKTLTDELDKARRLPDPEAEFQTIRQALGDLILRRADIQDEVATLLSETKVARDATEGFVRESDAVLAGENGPATVLARIPDVLQKIQNAEGSWPNNAINRFLADVDIWEGELGRISDVQWLVKNKDRVDAVKARFKELRDGVKALGRDGAADGPAARFDEAQRVLGQWKAIFLDAQKQEEAYFELPEVEVGCGFSFDQNKETEVKLVKQDRLAADAAVTEQELVTVVCSSPFSVSGGFGFSTLNEREFVFVQSTTPVTTDGETTQKVINRFGFKNNSSFRPIPVLLLNTRIHEWNDTLALHLSAGAGVDIKTGEAGTDVEFIVGPSISFKRSMFITAGLHVGRVPKLAGGFQLDQEVPEGIDAPPLEKAWKTGFITTVTFKLR